ncbi:MAG: flagellar motor protein MotB, partial [Bacteroidetes bacterium]
TKDGAKMYFSRNTPKISGEGSRRRILKIYQASLKNDTWRNVREVGFNGDDFSTCHPALSPDESQMFFASDRPGGLGGMDIWVTEWNGLGWGAPRNLGPEVNSPGNEIFPFVDENGDLYYASNGLGGLGGLDLFVAKQSGETWQRTHLPPPLNTKYDDFAMSVEKGGKTGYLTSNRKGGHGRDDIYQWEKTGDEAILQPFCVVDAKDNHRIADADISVRSNSEGQTQPLKNEALKSCGDEMAVFSGETYTFVVSKPGYTPKTITVSGADMLAVPEYWIPIEPLPVAVKTLSGRVVHAVSGAPVPQAEVRIRNQCTGAEMTLPADSDGAFHFEADCGCGYELIGKKSGFREGKKQLNAGDLNCENPDEKVEIPLSPAPDKKPEFRVGQIIKLDKLYYDYDKYYIRPDAAVELDKVVDLLKKYPSMEIELSSHTDSRGSDAYNLRLSENRAKAAVDYIISKGIDPRRVVARGYGETKLVNHCKNGVKCSDEEHQENRRTEIKVTAFDESGVEIRH